MLEKLLSLDIYSNFTYYSFIFCMIFLFFISILMFLNIRHNLKNNKKEVLHILFFILTLLTFIFSMFLFPNVKDYDKNIFIEKINKEANAAFQRDILFIKKYLSNEFIENKEFYDEKKNFENSNEMLAKMFFERLRHENLYDNNKIIQYVNFEFLNYIKNSPYKSNYILNLISEIESDNKIYLYEWHYLMYNINSLNTKFVDKLARIYASYRF